MKISYLRFLSSKFCWISNKRNISTGTVLNKLRFSYVGSTSDEPLLPWTIGNLVDRGAEVYGDREAIVVCHQKIRKNFHQLKTDVDKIAAGFVALGLKKGDRIGIWATNKYEWVLTQFAAAKAGLILVNINAAYQAKELEFCLRKVGAKALVMDDSYKSQKLYEILKSLIANLPESKEGNLNAETLPDLKYVISLSDKTLSGTYKFEDLFFAGGKNEMQTLEELESKIQFDEPANIIFTSGTTGKPKGATLSHHNLVNNAYLGGKRLGMYEKQHRLCIPSPLFHAFANAGSSIGCLTSGTCAIYPCSVFNAREVAKGIHEERATLICGTPTMFIDILNLSDFNQYDFTCLQLAIAGGSTCPEALMAEMANKMHTKDSVIGYGITETSPAISIHYPTDPIEFRQTNVGTVLSHTEVKIVDRNNRIVPLGAQGELWTRGYHVMLGYWNDPEKTKEVITQDRWYKTGDVATMDENGYLKIVGRIKDLIIRGGENIYPREIEDFLHTHEKIAEIQVVGVPDPRLGEEVCAWVKTKAGNKLTEEELREFCKGKLARFKIPRYIMFIEDFPKTATGKIQKYRITEEATKLLKLSN